MKTNLSQVERDVLHLIIVAARAAVNDATQSSNLEGRLAISRKVIEGLEAALGVYDHTLILNNTASVQVVITNDVGVLLDTHLFVSPEQAHTLADTLLRLARYRSLQTLKKRPKTIYFCRPREAYGFLSNFARYPIQLKGKIWPTVEHYIQAQKFADTAYQDAIRLAETPALAAYLGRDRTKSLRLDWAEVMGAVMQEAVLAKFTQHPKLREQLLNTGGAILVERSRSDRHSRNMLGRILMGVREKLKQQKQASDHNPTADPD